MHANVIRIMCGRKKQDSIKMNHLIIHPSLLYSFLKTFKNQQNLINEAVVRIEPLQHLLTADI